MHINLAISYLSVINLFVNEKFVLYVYKYRILLWLSANMYYSQGAKKKLPSRDIDTLTDEQLVATIGPHGEVELTLATDNKCVSTENDTLPNNPFAG